MKTQEKKTDPEKDEEKKVETEEKEESAEKTDSKENTELETENKADESENQEESPEEENQAEENGADSEESAEKTESENSEAETSEKSESQSGESDLKAQLLAAQAQLAAFKCGVRPEAVEDAVCLAINDAKKNGDVTADSIAEALSGVLNRHPDWKSFYELSNNFRIGADGMSKANSSIDEISKIFGNKE